MNTEEHCYCFKCGKQLENLAPTFDSEGYQPYEGTAFKTYGHYGSTAFDPMDGSSLEIVICDYCLETNMKHSKVPVVFEKYTEQYEWEMSEEGYEND